MSTNSFYNFSLFTKYSIFYYSLNSIQNQLIVIQFAQFHCIIFFIFPQIQTRQSHSLPCLFLKISHLYNFTCNSVSSQTTPSLHTTQAHILHLSYTNLQLYKSHMPSAFSAHAQKDKTLPPFCPKSSLQAL